VRVCVTSFHNVCTEWRKSIATAAAAVGSALLRSDTQQRYARTAQRCQVSRSGFATTVAALRLARLG